MAGPYDQITSDLSSFLHAKQSPLAPYAGAFVAAGRKYGVDPKLLVSIAGAESSFGKQNSGQFNPFGYGPGRDFPNYGAAIDTVSSDLARNYIGQGLTTVPQIAAKWAPVGAANDPSNLNSNWTRNVSSFVSALGGTTIPGPETGGGALASPATPDVTLRPVTNVTAAVSPPPPRLNTAPPPLLSGDLLGALNANNRLLGLPQLRLPQMPVAQPAPPSAPVPAAVPPRQPVPKRTTQVATAPAQTHAQTTGLVSLAPNADRGGAHIHPQVVQFVGDIAALYGHPLEIGTGTNHNEYVVGTRRQSAHWTGWAGDIPATGDDLTKIGYNALLAAGMAPRQAATAARRGGLFNLNGYQIIFKTTIGGNHWNHLHVGFAPSRQVA